MSLKYESIIKQMSLEEKALMMSGKNTWETVDFEKYGIPSMAMSDGPHGLRRQAGAGDHLGLNASLPATCFPTAASVANSWDEILGEEIGTALAEEAVTMDVNVILGPGLNIKRSPLCGRNFEYFSEDPLLTGKFAAAITKGVQKNRGCYVTLKHFCCNNQEDNRNKTNANVNERALREIYLKGFEIAVKESHPGAVMSSYNKVNGKYVNNSYRLLTQVLRNEWGFDGLVMTDWFATGRKYGDPAHAIASGNDLIMPGSSGTVDDIVKAVSKGIILEEDIKRSAANVLKGITSSRIYQGFLRKQRENGI